MNESLIFRDENGNTVLSISCFETRMRNRISFLGVEREKMKLIFTGISRNGNSRHSLLGWIQWIPYCGKRRLGPLPSTYVSAARSVGLSLYSSSHNTGELIINHLLSQKQPSYDCLNSKELMPSLLETVNQKKPY